MSEARREPGTSSGAQDEAKLSLVLPPALQDKIKHNALLVLGLEAGATRAEIERAARRKLDALALNLASAGTYATPMGALPCDESLVRAARHRLREPAGRAEEELWWIVAQRLLPAA